MQSLSQNRPGLTAFLPSWRRGISKNALGRGLKGGLALLALVFTLAHSATAATLPAINLGWNPNPERDITGYELSYGTASGDYTTRIMVGLDTHATVRGLTAGVRYYFVVRAINRAGLKSKPSKEVSYQGDVTESNQAPESWISAPSTSGTIVTGQRVEFSAGGSDPDGGKSLQYHWNFGAGSGIADSTSAYPGAVTFNKPGTYRVSLTVTDSKGLADPTSDFRTITVISAWSGIPRTGWKLEYVNSEEPDGYGATQSFDGNPATFWHTRFRAAHLPPPPHEIQLDLGATRLVTGFEYLPRQDGITVGDIGSFAFYVSKDGKKWGKPVTTGKFATSSSLKRVLFKAKSGRFIRLVSLAEANGTADCNVAELNVLQGPPSNRTPVAKAKAVSIKKNKALRITLNGSDADLNPLTYQIVSGPSHGKLTGLPPNLTYKPAKGFSGNDFFTYRIKDGLSSSKTVKVSIRVKPAGSKSKSALLAARGTSSDAGAEAFGIHSFTAKPAAAARTGSVTIDGLRYLTLTVTQPGATRNVQVSSNLVDWFSGNNHTTVLDDNERFLKVRDNTPLAPGRKRYIRLKTASR